ncbi:MAG: amino acid adenylation domain-containing protein, partial [Bacteroidales bacterium]|nr:amino acid adenylation domain-containing protein [Bacteroidales bacterium]
DTTSLPSPDLAASSRESFERFRKVLPFGEESVRGFCSAGGITPAVLASAVFGYVISRYTFSHKFAFATIYNGRQDLRTERTVSMLVKTLPVCGEIAPEQRVRDFLVSVKDRLVGAMANDIYSFAELSAATGLGSDVLFAYQGGIRDVPGIGDARLEDLHIEFNATGESLGVQLFDSPEGLVLDVQYRSDMYSRPFIEGLASSYGTAFGSMMKAATLSDVSVLDAEEEARLIDLSYGTKLDYDSDRTIPGRFREAAAADPSAKAVVCGTESYTYAELDAVSDRVAAKLVAAGVGRGEFVCIMLPRCREFAAAVLGIQKAGAAYVPVDIEYPEDRKNYMVQDSGAKAVITPEFFDDLPESGPVDLSEPENPAYMIYTSGSTGKPKGVVITHASVMACAAWNIPLCGMEPGRRYLHHPSFSFDASTMDLLYPLMAGAEVHILQEELRRDLGAVRRYCVDNHIYGLTLSTAMGMALLNQYELPVNYVTMGGEKMLSVRRTDARIINGYGPTEFTVCSSYHVVDQERDVDIPIGRPVPNSWSVICDADGHLLPQGVVGELCLIGPQIAEGYWQRPDVTREKFCKIKFEGAFGTDRMYRTGDLARYNARGELEFCGRIDFQVKLRGFRIEMGEIEACASSLEGVTAAAAEVRKMGGQDILCLYYTADRDMDDEIMRAHLSKSLTSYMVPDCFVRLDAMPLTPNGKVNRRALPEPKAAVSERVTPDTPTEKKIFALAAEVLGYDGFSVLDNLLSVGLTSLSAMKLSALLEQREGMEVPTRIILECGTVRAIASKADSDAGRGGIQEAEVHPVQEFYPLSESQKGVYMDWEMNRSALQYNTPFARKFSGCDAGRLKSAIEAVLNAHPALKSHLATQDSEVVVKRCDDALPVVSVSRLDFEPDADFFHTRMKPFDLFGDELYRFEIYESPASLYLFADVHHIIYDGGSTRVFFRDLELALSGEKVQKETYTAFDRTLDEKALMASDEYAGSERYFAELLSAFEVASWPHSSVPDSKTPGAARCRASLKAAAVEAFCRDNAVTANSFFMASFSELLRRVLRSGSLLYTSVSGGRTNAAMQDIVGMFVKTFPVVSPGLSDGPAAGYVKAVQQQYVATMSNGLYPYAEMVAKYGCRSEIMCNFEGGASFEASDVIGLNLDTVKMPLTLSVRPEGGEFTIIAEYDTSLYSAADMTLLVDSMASLSAAIAAGGNTLPLQRIPMLGEAESKRVLALSYGTKLDYDSDRT